MKESPRKKGENETQRESILRRLEEYMEYAHSAKIFSDYSFYKEVRDFIEDNVETSEG